jgi:crotonobetainyl-CoA:carnitine CoA-transferase CaiB-like acyl-CoA transferase
VLAALVGRLRFGTGAHLDVALAEVGAHSLVNVAQAALSTGQPARRHGNAHPHIVPYQTFAAGDGGLFVVAVGNDTQWLRLCAALEEPGLARDGRLAENPGRVEHRAELVGRLAARFATAPRATWLERLQHARVPCGPVREVHEAMADPALAARGMVAPQRLSGGLVTPLMALPWRVDGTRPPLELPPPGLGEHTTEFLEEFGGASVQ